MRKLIPPQTSSSKNIPPLLLLLLLLLLINFYLPFISESVDLSPGLGRASEARGKKRGRVKEGFREVGFDLPFEERKPVRSASTNMESQSYWRREFVQEGRLINLISSSCPCISFIHEASSFVISFLCTSNSLIYFSHLPTPFPSDNDPFALFLFLYPCLFCCRLLDHINVGSFLGFLFCCIDLCFCFSVSTMLFFGYYFSFAVKFEIREHDNNIIVLSKDCFGYLGSFVLSYKF